MSLIPAYYSAGTKAIAEKALERGVLKYPAICYIEESQILAWVTIDNHLKYINGNNPITDIKYIKGHLIFFTTGEKILYSIDVSISQEQADEITQNIINSLNLEQYVTTDQMVQRLDDIVGDLNGKTTIIDYINSLSYNSLSDLPILNLSGSITKPVYISSLEDGVYKISGQYVIGGNNSTIQSSSNDVFFIISRDPSYSITQIQSDSIKIYFIDSDGNCTTDRYITENWVNKQDFITSGNVKEYVHSTIENTVIDIIDKEFDIRLDKALDARLSNIPTEEIATIFN